MKQTTASDIAIAFLEKLDPVTSVLIFVVFVLAWLLHKSSGRMDYFLQELNEAGQTMKELTLLLKVLVYGRNKEGGK